MTRIFQTRCCNYMKTDLNKRKSTCFNVNEGIQLLWIFLIFMIYLIHNIKAKKIICRIAVCATTSELWMSLHTKWSSYYNRSWDCEAKEVKRYLQRSFGIDDDNDVIHKIMNIYLLQVWFEFKSLDIIWILFLRCRPWAWNPMYQNYENIAWQRWLEQLSFLL